MVPWVVGEQASYIIIWDASRGVVFPPPPTVSLKAIIGPVDGNMSSVKVIASFGIPVVRSVLVFACNVT